MADPKQPAEVEEGAEARQLVTSQIDTCLELEQKRTESLAERSKVLFNVIVAILAVGLLRFGMASSEGELSIVKLLSNLALATGVCYVLWAATYIVFRWDYEWRKNRLQAAVKHYSVASLAVSLLPEAEDLQYLFGEDDISHLRLKEATQKLGVINEIVAENATREAELSLTRIALGRGLVAISLSVVFFVASPWIPLVANMLK